MKIYMINFLYFLILVLSLNNLTFAMEKKPYHHLSDGTFRNPEGSPKSCLLYTSDAADED